MLFLHFPLICSCIFSVLEIILEAMSFQDSLFYVVIAIDGSLGLSCNLYKFFPIWFSQQIAVSIQLMFCC